MILFNARPGNGCVVSISGPIFDLDSTAFEACLGQADGGPLDVWVNSNGGDLQAGFAIRNLIAMYPGTVTVHAIGPVHSAASVAICTKNAHVVAHKGSAFMIHRCAALADGNSEDLRKTADVLDKLDEALVDVYKTRLNADDKAIKKMLAAETWLTPEDARALGLVDEIFEEDPDVPMMAPPAPAPDDAPAVPSVDDLIARAVAECSDRFSDAVKSQFSAVVGAAAAPAADAVSSACARLDASTDKAGAQFSDLSARLDALAEKCDALAVQNASLSEALSRAYALDGAGNPANAAPAAPAFKLNF